MTGSAMTGSDMTGSAMTGSAMTGSIGAAAARAGEAEALRRWLFDKALPLWWRIGADHANGGCHERIDCRGRPVGRFNLIRRKRQWKRFWSPGLPGSSGFTWRGDCRPTVTPSSASTISTPITIPA
jgi:hypothetical protein